MAEKNKKVEIEINDGHYIEVLDRCHCVGEIIENMLLNHPLIYSKKEWKDKIEKAQEIIGDVYQEIGNEMP